MNFPSYMILILVILTGVAWYQTKKVILTPPQSTATLMDVILLKFPVLLEGCLVTCKKLIVNLLFLFIYSKPQQLTQQKYKCKLVPQLEFVLHF